MHAVYVLPRELNRLSVLYVFLVTRIISGYGNISQEAQVVSDYNEGDAVHNQAGRSADISVKKIKYWICCVRMQADGTYKYRLKDKPKEEGGKTIPNGVSEWFSADEIEYWEGE